MKTNNVKKEGKEYLVVMHPDQVRWINSPAGRKLWKKLKLKRPRRMPHCCEGELPGAAHGSAIEDCCEDEQGRFWVSNVEYASQVNFCPYCGAKACVAATSVPERDQQR